MGGTSVGRGDLRLSSPSEALEGTHLQQGYEEYRYLLSVHIGRGPETASQRFPRPGAVWEQLEFSVTLAGVQSLTQSLSWRDPGSAAPWLAGGLKSRQGSSVEASLDQCRCQTGTWRKMPEQVPAGTMKTQRRLHATEGGELTPRWDVGSRQLSSVSDKKKIKLFLFPLP